MAGKPKDSEPRTSRLEIRITPRQRTAIEAMAHAEAKSIADLILERLLGKKRDPK